MSVYAKNLSIITSIRDQIIKPTRLRTLKTAYLENQISGNKLPKNHYINLKVNYYTQLKKNST